MRFIRAVVALITVLSLLIGAMLLVGHQLPPSERVKILHLDECKPPCWIGIVPGITTPKDARQIIRNNFDEYSLIENGYNFNVKDRLTQKQLFLVSLNSWDDKTIDEIKISLLPKVILDPITGASHYHYDIAPAYLGELATILGFPTIVTLWNSEGGTSPTVVYQNFKLVIDVGDITESSQLMWKLKLFDNFEAYSFF